MVRSWHRSILCRWRTECFTLARWPLAFHVDETLLWIIDVMLLLALHSRTSLMSVELCTGVPLAVRSAPIFVNTGIR